MPEEPAASPTLGTRILRRARAMLPWILGIGLIVWITGRVSWGEAWDAAGEAEVGSFAAVLIGAAIYWFLLDSWGYSFLFSRFNAPVSWAEARSVRGLTYLLTPINWNVGTAAVVLHLRQSKGISAVDGASSMMLYGAADGFVILALLVIGLVVVPDAGALGNAVPGIVGFFIFQCLFLVLVLSNSPKWGWLERIRNARLLQSYRKAEGADLALLLVVRSIYFAGFVGFFAFGTRAFDIEVPIGFMAMTMPLVMGAAMFTPAGMGSQQAVMLELWEAHGTAASILAFGVAFPVGLIIARFGIGLLYLGDLREFRRARKAALAEEALQVAEEALQSG